MAWSEVVPAAALAVAAGWVAPRVLLERAVEEEGPAAAAAAVVVAMAAVPLTRLAASAPVAA